MGEEEMGPFVAPVYKKDLKFSASIPMFRRTYEKTSQTQ
jgi:hypothetical protein